MKPVTRREIFENAVAEGKDPGIKPLTREEAILAKHAKREASGGSGGVTSWNDLTDKPFGEEVGEVVMYDGEVAVSEVPMEGITCGVLSVEGTGLETHLPQGADANLFDGTVFEDYYTITFGGNTYENLPVVLGIGGGMSNYGECMIGNQNLSSTNGYYPNNPNASLPFCLSYRPNQKEWVLYVNPYAGSVFDLTVTVTKEIVTPLDPKYLSHMTVFVTEDMAGGYRANYKGTEIKAALDSGIPVLFYEYVSADPYPIPKLLSIVSVDTEVWYIGLGGGSIEQTYYVRGLSDDYGLHVQ